jgi:pyrroloquinoline quinone (PQQ) biosynthesis protein C
MSKAITDPRLQQFAKAHDLVGLTAPSLKALVAERVGYSLDKARRFLAFQRRIDDELLRHRIITNNRYTAWFKRGEQTFAQIRAFIVQFSVFSNQFLIAQLQKMINADSLEGMRASKEILANEIGVVFNAGRKLSTPKDTDREGDPQLVSTEGTVEGGVFRFRAAHFEWLLRIAERLGLSFNELGKRKDGTPSTLYFCDELVRLYGSEDYAISQAASYAVENWAAAGFWEELIEGLSRYNARTGSDLPLAFFTWHNRLEAQHAQHTQEELEDLYFTRDIDEDAFIRYGNEMLDGVAAFWDGLDEQRKQYGLETVEETAAVTIEPA